MRLEHELRRALQRKDPPGGFDDRVLSRIAAGETVRVASGGRRWTRAALPLAASVMMAAGATYYVHWHEGQEARLQQARTAQAAHDVVLALQIASEKIAAAQVKVEEITRDEPTNNR